MTSFLGDDWGLWFRIAIFGRSFLFIDLRGRGTTTFGRNTGLLGFSLEVEMVLGICVVLHGARPPMSMPVLAYMRINSSVKRSQSLRIIEHLPHVPHCDLSPSGPFLLPIAMLSGHPQFEQCHTPSM